MMLLIIGGGVTGSAIARELSRYDLKTALFEKGEDVCSGTSKANSGIAHAGFDAAPGSWKAKMNIRGSRMLEELSRKLDFPYKRNGSLVLCFDEKDRPIWKKVLSVEGYTCKRGHDYGEKECTNPMRTVTSSVPVKNGVIPMVSVKTAADIPKGKILECMEAIHTAAVQAPVHLGDIILADIAGTGVDLIATKTVGRR